VVGEKELRFLDPSANRFLNLADGIFRSKYSGREFELRAT
jgi:hypothetical protein